MSLDGRSEVQISGRSNRTQCYQRCNISTKANGLLRRDDVEMALQTCYTLRRSTASIMKLDLILFDVKYATRRWLTSVVKRRLEQNINAAWVRCLSKSAFPWGLRRQQLEIRPRHFTVFHHLPSFRLGEVPRDFIQDPQCNWSIEF